MKSRWKWAAKVEPDTDYLVLASSIPPRGYRSTWALFRGSRAVRRQLLSTDGVIGFALLAEPVRKRYATLSVWRDEDALAAFAKAEPHRQLMAELTPRMAPTTFVRWTIPGSGAPPPWADALRRLEAAAS
jgi:hypothetical protein